MSTEPKSWSIYCITNITNNKRYIGQTCASPKARWRKHVWLATTRNGNTRFYAAIRKHGVANFRISTLQEGISSIMLANEAEKRWVSELLTTNQDFGYNMTTGGDQQDTSGWTMTSDACEKISQAKIGKLNTTRRLRTQEEDRPIMEAFNAGKPRAVISQELNVTGAKVQKALARWKDRIDPSLDVGKDAQYKNSGASLQRRAADVRQPIVDALQSGMSRQEVMAKFDVTMGRVKGIIAHEKRKLEATITQDDA